MFFFLLTVKRKKQRKLPAAPDSLKGCGFTFGVVAEPDDADWEGKTEGLCFLLRTSLRAIAWELY